MLQLSRRMTQDQCPKLMKGKDNSKVEKKKKTLKAMWNDTSFDKEKETKI